MVYTPVPLPRYLTLQERGYVFLAPLGAFGGLSYSPNAVQETARRYKPFPRELAGELSL